MFVCPLEKNTITESCNYSAAAAAAAAGAAVR
jgi:hypothetical protein